MTDAIAGQSECHCDFFYIVVLLSSAMIYPVLLAYGKTLYKSNRQFMQWDKCRGKTNYFETHLFLSKSYEAAMNVILTVSVEHYSILPPISLRVIKYNKNVISLMHLRNINA